METLVLVAIYVAVIPSPVMASIVGACAVVAIGAIGKPDQLEQDKRIAENRQEALIDEGVEESFPASDPVSVKRIT